MSIYLEKTDIYSTLTTWLYCHYWQMWAAEQLGKESYINWHNGVLSYNDSDKFSQIPNQYEWYFEQPFFPRPIWETPYQQPIRDETWTWENWVDPSPVGFMAQPLTIIKEYYQRHLKFNETTNQRGQAIVDKYKIDFTKTIGITWRGTDIYLDGRPRIPIETYFPFIDEVLTDNMRIMCTAEETGILDPLLERYSQAFVIEEFISAPNGGKDNPERFSNVSGYERGLQPVLMVWLFSKCAHYIKNRSSTGAAASWLSKGRIVSIAHPENLGFPANTNTAEIEGKLYPLNL